MSKMSSHEITIVPIDEIKISERIRKQVDEKKIEELAQSIKAYGLLHPITVVETEEGKELIAGFRRLSAIKLLRDQGVESYQFSQTEISTSSIPTVMDVDEGEIRKKEVELEENLRRINLTWQEEAQAITQLHELRKEQNPKHTLKDTAEEISELRNIPKAQTAATVSKAVAVSKFLDDPDVKRSPSLYSAYRKVVKKAKREIEAALLKKTKSDDAFQFFEKDFNEVEFEGDFDCIIADPPYGIDAGKFARASLAHQYDDKDIEVAKQVIDLACKYLARRGVLFLFCDIEYFIDLREYASSKGLGVRRVPLIWYHPHVGHDSSGRGSGFRRNSELILCAWKEYPLFKGVVDDVFTVSHVTQRQHPAQKPVKLYKVLLDTCCSPGARVLDPCCGSGTIFKAARALGMQAVGCENSGIYAPLAEIAAKGESEDIEDTEEEQ